MKNELFELVSRRRSVRQYGDKKIDDQIIGEIMKVALTAPSSFGHRPVEFVVVRDKETIKKLASCKSYGGSQIIGADAVIVVFVSLDRGEFWIEDGSIASAYISSCFFEYLLNPNNDLCNFFLLNGKDEFSIFVIAPSYPT